MRFREEVNKRERERESFPAETGLVRRLSVEWTRMAGAELSRGTAGHVQRPRGRTEC